ncbi:uncharacterized protein LOC142980284 [Anticarsia gemmatalis]|uniref:uncharacterized protein LOC142980284 n=1 Tax=Anticarsia gemmatalis TaxID=129554 RepID=UPI003F75C1EB
MPSFYWNTYSFVVIFAVVIQLAAASSCSSCNRFQDLGKQLFNVDGRKNNNPSTTQPPLISPQHPTKGRKRCCPYEFDRNFCRVVGERLLCGYNKNVGTPQPHDEIHQLSEHCRIRRGRLECGYEIGPFTNPRRPPMWDNRPPSVEVDVSEPDKTDEDYDPENSKEVLLGSDEPTVTKSPQQKPPKPKKTTKNRKTTRKRVTRCVETADNRIVCKTVTKK